MQALEEGHDPEDLVDPRTRLLLDLSVKVTRHAYKVTDEDIEGLRSAGWSDEEILEAVHTACMFNYMDRMADTLGLEALSFPGLRGSD